MAGYVTMISKTKSLFVLTMVAVVAFVAPLAVAQDITGEDVVRHCEYKDPGEDQRSRLGITLVDKDGNQRKNVYRRLWKNYHGEDEVVDKMVLFTEFPPDAEGTGFLRWGYTAASGKKADQWLYLPQLRKIRRISVRDPGDSFLGSDLTYGDIDDRPISADMHELMRITNIESRDYYVVASKPKESNPLYSVRVSWFLKTPRWNDCVRAKTQYYDLRGNLLKVQELAWQKVGDAWVWDRVYVHNVQTDHKSLFQVTDVEINVGLKDRTFTDRTLKKGQQR